MAPKKKRGNESVETSVTGATTKATRGATSRGDAALTPSVDNPEVIARKKPKTTAAASSSAASKTIIIEHCKQSSSFKTKANQVKKGLEKAVAGVKVELNPEIPREGGFEIRQEGGDTFVSMLGMESPFEEIKALDVNKVVSDIVERINRS